VSCTALRCAQQAIRKVLAGDYSDKKRAGHVDSIKRELEVLRKLSGSLNVVRLLDVYEDEHNVFVVQELCKGGELWHRIGDRHYSERTVRRGCWRGQQQQL
jgi:calcium-dependent protein kinase